MLHGIINIYKEAGFTSHDVVAKMRGICQQKKIGHTGTLDPNATGVLPVCLGAGTKLCDMMADKDKEYVAELLLGVTTDTQDTTGAILSENEVKSSCEEVADVIMDFQGEYQQIPPMYSALKVNGQKLYELARAGIEVERKARPVSIHEIEILHMELPKVKIRVVCSKGTYIRTLCADIGAKLGCGGTMASLVRTRVGKFSLEDAITLTQLQALRDEDVEKIESNVHAVEDVLEEYPALHLLEEYSKIVENGNSFYPNQALEKKENVAGEWVRIYNHENRFFGIYSYDTDREMYRPVKMFLMQE